MKLIKPTISEFLSFKAPLIGKFLSGLGLNIFAIDAEIMSLSVLSVFEYWIPYVIDEPPSTDVDEPNLFNEKIFS